MSISRENLVYTTLYEFSSCIFLGSLEIRQQLLHVTKSHNQTYFIKFKTLFIALLIGRLFFAGQAEGLFLRRSPDDARTSVPWVRDL